MKRSLKSDQNKIGVPCPRPSADNKKGKIHPVIIYPFRPTGHYTDLQNLFEMVGTLAKQTNFYGRPITVIDRKTHHALEQDAQYLSFRNDVVAKHSEILDVWCVDTCQMWYAGLGKALEQGQPEDVYWLIPGDFDYGSAPGKEVLSYLHDLPEICFELNQDICIGEVTLNPGSSKALIDTYGTLALLYVWFPKEAVEILQDTVRPRSEFFAIRHAFLKEMLNRRWYPFEQTLVLLVHALKGHKNVTRFAVGNISDLAGGKESLSAAIQQVERTELVLKSLWREYHNPDPDWIQQYRILETKSSQARQAAISILENQL